MKPWTTLGILAACVAPNCGIAHAASISSVAEHVAAVRGVFAAKCSGCHGPDLPQPKGRFGYVLDLHRIAESPEMVIPSSPDESELWALVKAGEMPPPDSPRGPLNAAEKDIIRTWIAEGAQDIAPPATTDSSSVNLPERVDSGESLAPDVPESAAAASTIISSLIPREILSLGRFHLLAIHFPIALMIVAGVAEFWAAWRRSQVHLQSVSFCLRLAAIAAIPTAALGWLYAAAGNGAGSHLLIFHRWIGTATAACIVAAAVCGELDQRRGKSRLRLRALMTAAALLTIATAHIGGLLAHGVDFYSW